MSIARGPSYLKTTEGRVSLALSFILGSATGWITQAASAHLARDLGDQLIKSAGIREAVRQAASSRGVWTRSFAEIADYWMSHPGAFAKAVLKYIRPLALRNSLLGRAVMYVGCRAMVFA